MPRPQPPPTDIPRALVQYVLSPLGPPFVKITSAETALVSSPPPSATWEEAISICWPLGSRSKNVFLSVAL